MKIIERKKMENRKLEHVTLTAVVNGEPVLIAINDEQKKLLVDVVLPSLFCGHIKVIKLDTEVHKLGTFTFQK